MGRKVSTDLRRLKPTQRYSGHQTLPKIASEKTLSAGGDDQSKLWRLMKGGDIDYPLSQSRLGSRSREDRKEEELVPFPFPFLSSIVREAV